MSTVVETSKAGLTSNHRYGSYTAAPEQSTPPTNSKAASSMFLK